MGTLKRIVSKQQFRGLDAGRIFLLKNISSMTKNGKTYEEGATIRIDAEKWQKIQDWLQIRGNEQERGIFMNYQALCIWIADVQLQLQGDLYAANAAYKTIKGEMIANAATASGMLATLKTLPVLMTAEAIGNMKNLPDNIQKLASINGTVVINGDKFPVDENGVYKLPEGILNTMGSYWLHKYKSIPSIKTDLEEQWETLNKCYFKVIRYNAIIDILKERLGLPEMEYLQTSTDILDVQMKEIQEAMPDFFERINAIPYMTEAEKDSIKTIYIDAYPDASGGYYYTIPEAQIERAKKMVTRTLSHFTAPSDFFRLYTILTGEKKKL